MKIKSILFFLYCSTCFSQTKITGVISTLDSVFLENATVVIKELKTNKTLNYTSTDSKGFFNLTIKTTNKPLQIEISYLGYKNIKKPIANKSQVLNFKMQESTETLQETIIKTKAITQRNDTISYSLSKFRDKKDVVIADILKKLPGIEVEESGKILYQGKPIQKYYIEGLDLLEGKYNLANNNIAVEDVSRIQILENHQPIKLLDNIVFSDQASLNIKLKKKNVLLGTAKLGVGYSPFLWNANITPMLFSKKKQFLASYKSNNTGKDVSKDLNTLTFKEYLTQLKENLKNKKWLSILHPKTPLIRKKYWLDNNIQLLSVNYLQKLSSKTELKTHISYIYNKQKELGSSTTTIFTSTKKIKIEEKNYNKLSSKIFRSKFTVENNTKKNYFKNSLSLQTNALNEQGFLTTKKVLQKYKNPYTLVTNSLKWLLPYRGKIISINSKIIYSNSTENLNTTPGQFNTIINNGKPYKGFLQNVNISNFFTDNYGSFIKSFKKFTYLQDVGFEIASERLNSAILISKKNKSVFLGNFFKNNTIYKTSKIYSNSTIKFQKNKIKSSISLPISYVRIKKLDDFSKQNKEVILEPSILLSSNFNAYWKASVTFNSKKTYGSLRELYPNYIIQNYRSIVRNRGNINKTRSNKYKVLLSYKNLLKGFFLTSSLNF
ncbi:MAG: carboxypeptidase-like regulatory domain-containing protein, partial [Polaribacter sp.]